jgi:uncharacterized protein
MSFILLGLLIFLAPAVSFAENTTQSDTDISAAYTSESAAGGLFDFIFYQYRGIFRDVLARKCVYSPSCSHFGQQAINSHGPVAGLMMALERWTRCTSAAYGYEDYEIADEHRLSDPVNPGKETICWGRYLLPF